MKYTLFISRIGRDPMDGGGLLIKLKSSTIEDARREARTHMRDDEEICDQNAKILVITYSEDVT